MEPHHTTPLFSLLLITVLAVLVPIFLSRVQRVRIPVVIGEIIAGIIIGKSGLNIIESSPVLEFLSEFGFVILMFISGLELDLASVSISNLNIFKRGFWRSSLPLPVLSFVCSFCGALTMAYYLEQIGLTTHPVILGLILSTTSLGIVVPVLKERGVITDNYGQLLVMTALLADFITLILLSLTLGTLKKGFFLQFLFFLILLTVFAITLKTGIRVRNLPVVKNVVRGLATATVQIRTRFSIALMVTWVALARTLGTEVILGAFLAGLIMSIMASHDKILLKEKLDTLGFGFFIPIFFITVGTQFDAKIFFTSKEAYVLLPILLAAAYAVKVVPSLLYWFKFSFRDSMAAGFLLSSRLSLIIAASTLAFRMGVINEAVSACIVVLAMITCSLSPIIFNKLFRTPPVTERSGIIVVGIDHDGFRLVERLLLDGEQVTVLIEEGQQYRGMHQHGLTVVNGNPPSEKILQSIGAHNAAGLICLLNDIRLNTAICRMAREKFKIPTVVSCDISAGDADELKALGVRIVERALSTAIALEAVLRFPATFDMIARHPVSAEIGEAMVLSSRFQGVPLSDVKLPGNTLIIGVRREGDIIIPHGTTILLMGDVLMLIGNQDSIREARKFLRT